MSRSVEQLGVWSFLAVSPLLWWAARAALILGLTLLSAFMRPAAAVPGDIDPTFAPSTGGKIFARLAGAAGSSNGTLLAIQPAFLSPGLLVGGECEDSTNGRRVCLARYLLSSPNGAAGLDVTAFGTSGVASVLSGWFDVSVRSIVVQADLRIVIAGSCRSTGGNWMFCVTRLLSNGALDTSFGGTGVVTTDFATTTDDEINAAALQPDGKLVVAGRCLYGAPPSTDYGFCLARYLTDGSLDASFDGDGKVLTNINAGTGRRDEANQIHLLSDGQMLVSGTCNNGTTTQACVVRYQANGVPDSAFGAAGVVNLTAAGSTGSSASALQPDGKLLLAVGCGTGFCALRMLADGSLDEEYGTAGLAAVTNVAGTRTVSRALLQADGKLLLGGWCDNGTTSVDFCVGRLHDTGQVDIRFGNGGMSSVPFATGAWQDYLHGMLIGRDGKLIVAGNCEDSAFASYEACMTRLELGSLASRNCTLDLNADGRTDAMGDAIILARVLLGLTGAPVLAGTPNAIAPSGQWLTVRDRLFYQCGLPVTP